MSDAKSLDAESRATTHRPPSIAIRLRSLIGLVLAALVLGAFVASLVGVGTVAIGLLFDRAIGG